MTIQKRILHIGEPPTSRKYDNRACGEVPEKNGTVESNTVGFIEGTVTQGDLQEVMVFLNSSDFQVVKEVSIDDGLYNHGKVLFENSEVGGNMNSLLKTSTTDASYAQRQRMSDGVTLVKEDLKFSSIFDEDTKYHYSMWSLFEGQQQLGETNQIASNTSEQKITLRQLFFLTEFDTDAENVDPSSCVCHNNHTQYIDQKGFEQVTSNIANVRLEENECGKNDESSMILENLNGDTSNGNLEKLGPSAATMPFDVKFSDQIGRIKENPPDAQVVYTSDLTSGPASEENRVDTYEQQLLNARFHFVNDEVFPVAATDSDHNLFRSNNNKDIHFSGCRQLTGSKVTSGHIAYSGNISFRSDSSANSTRSFAFPVLQREWNTSPVRMAKADHRHFRRGWWRMDLFCCKF